MNLKKAYRQLRVNWKTLRLRIGYAILDKKKSEHQLPLMMSSPKILLVRHDGKLGDYVISAFVFREIKKQWPKAYIGVIAAQGNASLLKQNPYIDDVFIVTKKNHINFRRLGKVLAEKHFDVLIDPTEVIRNRDLSLIKAVDAKNNIGFNQKLKLFNVIISNKKQRMKDVYTEILVKLGCSNVDMLYALPVDQLSETKVVKFLQENGIQQYIAVNLYAASKHKQFSIEKACELLECLHELYPAAQLVLLGDPRKTNELIAIKKQMVNFQVYLMPDIECIQDNIELIRGSSGVVSPDTSISHIATELDKPLIVFYNSDDTQYAQWQPSKLDSALVIRTGYELNEMDFSLLKESNFRLNF